MVSLQVDEHRRALLQVRHHRLDLVRRADQVALLHRLLGEAGFRIGEHGVVEDALGGADGVRVLAGDLAGRGQRLANRPGRVPAPDRFGLCRTSLTSRLRGLDGGHNGGVTCGADVYAGRSLTL